MRKTLSTPPNLKRFLANKSGVAAIEFALIFPLLILILFACIELYGHFSAVRKIAKVTASLADIVAQSRSITEEQLKALNPLAKSLMQPLDSEKMTYTIASIRQGDDTKPPKLVWEHEQSSSASKISLGGNGKCRDYADAGNKKFPPNQDVIFVNIKFTYESLFENYIGGPTIYEDNMIAIPRASATVILVDKSGNRRSKCS